MHKISSETMHLPLQGSKSPDQVNSFTDIEGWKGKKKVTPGSKSKRTFFFLRKFLTVLHPEYVMVFSLFTVQTFEMYVLCVGEVAKLWFLQRSDIQMFRGFHYLMLAWATLLRVHVQRAIVPSIYSPNLKDLNSSSFLGNVVVVGLVFFGGVNMMNVDVMSHLANYHFEACIFISILVFFFFSWWFRNDTNLI